MDRTPDVEVIFEFNGIRKNPVFEGYRPDHLVRDGYLTSGEHHYYDTETVSSDGTARGTIIFVTPEDYPNSMWIGKKISICEGERTVGTATVTEIYNPILER